MEDMEKTLVNLAMAFVGESQARNRYNMYASIARKEWYLQIADIFDETAEQEREHASWFFKMIQQLEEKIWKKAWDMIIETSVPIKKATTIENLKYAVDGETHEFTEMYPEFARIAEEEWLMDIAVRIKSIAKAESHHANRYQRLLEQVSAETVWKKEDEVERVCSKCWYIHKWKNPPAACPSCGHEKEYFEVRNEIY